MVIKRFKHNKRTVCYIEQQREKFYVKTGNPSDVSSMAWIYDNYEDAEFTANEFFNNFTMKHV